MLKIQKYLYYLLLFVTPFIMFSNTSELFEFNKLIFIYIISSLIFCLWLARMLEARKILFKRTPFDVFIGLFLLSQLLSTLFSIDIHTSIFGYYGRFNGGLLSIISYLVVYYSLAEFLSVFEDRKAFIFTLVKISLTASTLVILWGLPGRFGHDLSCLVFSGKFDNACWTSQFDPAARMFSTLGQPNWLGAYLDITILFALYYFLRAPLKSRFYAPYLLGGLTLLHLVAIYFTNSRSSVVAVLVGIGLVLGWAALKRSSLGVPALKFKLLGTIVAIALSVLIFKTGIASVDKYLSPETYFKPATKQEAPAAGTTKVAAQSNPLNITDSFVIRKIVWQGAEKLGMQYPLFGTGVETFAYSYYFVRPQAHNMTSEWDYLYNKAHNEYLNYFATTGFLGVGTYLLYIVAVLVLTLIWLKPALFGKDEHPDLTLLQVVLLGSWVSILITNFFGFSTTVITLFFYTIPALLFYLQILKKPQAVPLITEKKVQSLSGSGALIAYGIPFILAIFFLQYFVSYWLADTKFALAENLAKANDYQNSVTLLNEAMQLRPDHVYEDKLSYYLASLAFIASYQKNAQLANQLVQASAKYNDHSLQQSPQNILYWKTKVKDLYIYYQITLDKRYIQEGMKALQTSEKLSPTDPKLPYFIATYDSILYDEEKDQKIKAALKEQSLSEVNKSIALKSDYFESYYLKAQLYRKYKMIPQAKETYEYILKNVSPGNTQIENELKAI